MLKHLCACKQQSISGLRFCVHTCPFCLINAICTPLKVGCCADYPCNLAPEASRFFTFLLLLFLLHKCEAHYCLQGCEVIRAGFLCVCLSGYDDHAELCSIALCHARSGPVHGQHSPVSWQSSTQQHTVRLHVTDSCVWPRSMGISMFRAISSATRNEVSSLIVGCFFFLALLLLGGFLLPRCTSHCISTSSMIRTAVSIMRHRHCHSHHQHALARLAWLSALCMRHASSRQSISSLMCMEQLSCPTRC